MTNITNIISPENTKQKQDQKDLLNLPLCKVMNCYATAYQRKTGRLYFDVLIGYNSLYKATRIKSK